MLRLPNVTLLIMSPENNFRAERLYQHLLTKIEPDAWVIYDNRPSQTWKECQHVQATQLTNMFETSHLLHCEWDGYPLNLDKWDPAFMEYDYIGAPWEPGNIHYGNNRVGNGGFSLSSKRFRDALLEFEPIYPKYAPSDVWFAQVMHKRLEEMGMKFAPLDVAIRFSFELPIPEFNWNPDDSFGFHGKFNYFKQHFKIYE